jgi:hypothetical protein
VFVDFSRIFLLGILIFKGLTARRLYKSFGVKGLKHTGKLSFYPSALVFKTLLLVHTAQDYKRESVGISEQTVNVSLYVFT